MVGEFQDLSTRDLALLRRIAANKENSLFLTGDTVQRILVKDLRLGAVGFDIINSSWERIKKNYRNSKQILLAASRLANLYGEQARGQGVEIEVLDPELAERETSKPLAIAVGENREIAAAYELAKECLEVGSAIPWAICIATAAPDEIPIKSILAQKPNNFPVQVDALTGDYNRNRDSMTVGSIADVKGFEFAMIIIVGCGAKLLPPTNGCSEEAWRHALRLYVAMTRGRDQVAMIYSGEPSKFLDVMRKISNGSRGDLEFLPPFQGLEILWTVDLGRRSQTRFAMGYYLSGFQPFHISQPQRGCGSPSPCVNDKPLLHMQQRFAGQLFGFERAQLPVGGPEHFHPSSVLADGHRACCPR